MHARLFCAFTIGRVALEVRHAARDSSPSMQAFTPAPAIAALDYHLTLARLGAIQRACCCFGTAPVLGTVCMPS
jgi:hypothetical protein